MNKLILWTVWVLNLKIDFFFFKRWVLQPIKGKAESDKEYENAKKNYTLLNMRNLSDLNDLYSAQDIILF